MRKMNYGDGTKANPAGDNHSLDYYWSFQYYDYVPISFDGLRVNRYSIVISFWFGLAAFILFMFCLLILLVRSGSKGLQQVDRGLQQIPRAVHAAQRSNRVSAGDPSPNPMPRRQSCESVSVNVWEQRSNFLRDFNIPNIPNTAFVERDPQILHDPHL